MSAKLVAAVAFISVAALVWAGDAKGIIVESVARGSLAEKAGIKVGDRLLSYDGKPLLSPFTLLAWEENTFDKQSVEVVIRRDEQEQTVKVPLGSLGVTCRPELSAEALNTYMRMQAGGREDAAGACDAARLASGVGEAWLEVLELQALQAMDKHGDALAVGKISLAGFEGAGDDAGASWSRWQMDVSYKALGRTAEKVANLQSRVRLDEPAGRLAWLAGSYNEIGAGEHVAGKLHAAETWYRKAFQLQERTVPDGLDIAVTYDNLGWLAADRGDVNAEAAFFRKSLDIRRGKDPEGRGMAASFANMGAVARTRGDPVSAADWDRQALALYEMHAPDSLDAAATYDDLGNDERARGNLERAATMFSKARAIYERKAPNSLDLAANYNNLGILAWTCGDLEAAGDWFGRALALFAAVAPDTVDVAAAYTNMGNVAQAQGDLDAARFWYMKDLAICESVAPVSLGTAATYSDLGVEEETRGDLASAEMWQNKALNIRLQLAPDGLDSATSFANLGEIAIRRGRLPDAERRFRTACDIERRTAPNSLSHALSLIGLGDVALLGGRTADAQKLYSTALAVCRRQAPGSLWEATASYSAGQAAYFSNDIAGAERLAGTAWVVAKSRAEKVYGEEARMAFAQATTRYGNTLSFYRARLGRSKDAAETLIETQAQGLQLLVCERGLLGHIEKSPKYQRYLALVGKKNLMLKRAGDASVQQTDLDIKVRAADAAGHAVPRALKEARAKALTASVAAMSAYAEARIAADRAWADIVRENPRVFPKEVAVAEAQKALPAGSLYLGFSVCSEGVVTVALGPTGKPAAYVSKLKERDLDRLLTGEGGLPGTIRAALVDWRSDPPVGPLRKLYRDLFPPALRARIAKAERLIVTPDGPLWNMPLGVLVMNSAGPPRYLGIQKPMTYTPALALFVRAQTQKVQVKHVGSLKACVLGGVEFDTDAPTKQAKLRGDESASSAGTDVAADPLSRRERSCLWLDGKPPKKLEKSVPEARSIASLYHASPLMGRDATEKAVRAEAPTADIIHLATHGVFLRMMPMASGVLLAPPAKTAAPEDTKNDGALQAWEIMSELKLKADLAVLSACETARGKNVRGEGIVGLTRALEYAGARAVVTSLWKVDDEATGRLMVAFHKGVRNGLQMDEALRRAMVKVWKASPHPYYWSAFTLSGDFRNAIRP